MPFISTTTVQHGHSIEDVALINLKAWDFPAVSPHRNCKTTQTKEDAASATLKTFGNQQRWTKVRVTEISVNAHDRTQSYATSTALAPSPVGDSAFTSPSGVGYLKESRSNNHGFPPQSRRVYNVRSKTFHQHSSSLVPSPLSHSAAFAPPFTNPFRATKPRYSFTNWDLTRDTPSLNASISPRNSRISDTSIINVSELPQRPEPILHTHSRLSRRQGYVPQPQSEHGNHNPPKSKQSSSWAAIASTGLPPSEASKGKPPTQLSNKQPSQEKQEAPKNASNIVNDNRKAEHLPRTGQTETDIYVLTLWVGDELQEKLDKLRRKYYPPGQYKVPAHISFFRALPGSKLDEICADLDDACKRAIPSFLRAGKVLRMSRGIAILLDRPTQDRMRELWEPLNKKWWDFLSDQDREKFSGHWTIVNKADRHKDAKLLEEAENEGKQLQGQKGDFKGLILWKFADDGSWALERKFRIRSGEVEE